MPGFIRKLPFLDRFLHKAVPVGFNHIPYNWAFADATARTAAGNYITSDLGKFARQLSDNTIWMLTATTPTWAGLGSASGLATSDITAFYAYQTPGQSIPSGTMTKLNFQTIVFDTKSEFNTGTATFTATNAGYYMFAAGNYGNSSSSIIRAIALYKNGVEVNRLAQSDRDTGQVEKCGVVGPLSLAAGDAITIYYYSSVADTLLAGQQYTYFSGVRVR